MFRRKPSHSQETQFAEFQVESLEDRQMLAGDVDVFVRGNNLVISGDGADNNIEVISSEGLVQVVGNGETTVNGGDTALNVDDVRNLTIRMNGGDDNVIVSIRPNGNLNFRGGAGNDHIDVNGAGNNLTMRGGTGDDALHSYGDVGGNLNLFDVAGGNDNLGHYSGTVDGQTRIVTGAGDDQVDFGASVFGSSIFSGRVTVRTAAGQDSFNSGSSVQFESGAQIALGSGDDTSNLTLFNLPTVGSGQIVSMNGGTGMDTMHDWASIDATDEYRITGFETEEILSIR